MQLPHAETGKRTALLVNEHAADVRKCGGVLLLRHSAREFEPGRHDLLNPLTQAGRDLALSLGRVLPDELRLRGYASPAERCMETAELMLSGYAAATSREVGRTRPMEGLGVFYVLDQMKMYRAMQAAGGLRGFVASWVANELSQDTVLPAQQAVAGLLNGLAQRLATTLGPGQLDVCVSHDLTLQVVRSVIYELLPTEDSEVEFLDALLLVQQQGEVVIVAHDYPARSLSV